MQLVHQRINLPIRGINLPLQRRLLVLGAGGGKLLVQGKYLLNQRHHLLGISSVRLLQT